jgi:hypothetical protein
MRMSRVLVAGIAAGLAIGGCGTATSSSGGAGSTVASSSTSNGIESMTAQQILAATKTAALAQKSVHVSGKVLEGGVTMVSMDLSLVKGVGGYGTIAMGKLTFQIVTTPTAMYLKADKSFWEMFGGPGGTATVGDRWAKMPLGQEDFADLGSMSDFTKMIGDVLKPSRTITKGATQTISGQPALGLVDSDGSTLWVATTGDPLPVLISSPASASASPQGSSGGFAFTDWNQVADPVAPPTAQTLDLSQLGMG